MGLTICWGRIRWPQTPTRTGVGSKGMLTCVRQSMKDSQGISSSISEKTLTPGRSRSPYSWYPSGGTTRGMRPGRGLVNRITSLIVAVYIRMISSIRVACLFLAGKAEKTYKIRQLFNTGIGNRLAWERLRCFKFGLKSHLGLATPADVVHAENHRVTGRIVASAHEH